MVPLMVVSLVFVALRTAGALGVRSLRDWRLDLRLAMAAMLLVTASGHWGAKRADLVAMVPPVFPSPEVLVTLTGLLELLGAVGLLVPRTTRLAAVLLAVLFVALFPANVYAAQQHLTIGGRPVTELPLRTAVQVALIAGATALALPRRAPEPRTMEACAAH
jgi:uncharacterized membrane protein